MGAWRAGTAGTWAAIALKRNRPLTAALAAPNPAVARRAGWPRKGLGPFEESPDSLKQRCRVTPGQGNLTDSATENRLPVSDTGEGETVG